MSDCLVLVTRGGGISGGYLVHDLLSEGRRVRPTSRTPLIR